MVRALATLAMLIALVWGSAAQAAKAPRILRYEGADGRLLVLSISVTPLATRFFFKVRRLDAPGEGVIDAPMTILNKAEIAEATPASLWADAVAECYRLFAVQGYRGRVLVDRLPPGSYQIEAIKVTTAYGMIESEQDVKDIAIPFAIETGRATYIGEYKAVALEAKTRLGSYLFQGWNISVQDRRDRDLPLALSRVADLGEPRIEVFDVDTLQRRDIRSLP